MAKSIVEKQLEALLDTIIDRLTRAKEASYRDESADSLTIYQAIAYMAKASKELTALDYDLETVERIKMKYSKAFEWALSPDIDELAH